MYRLLSGLVFLLLLLYPLGNVLHVSLPFGIGLTPQDVMVCVFGLLFYPWFLVTKQKVSFPFVWFFFGFLAIGIGSLVIRTYPFFDGLFFSGLLYSFRLLALFAVFLFMIVSPPKSRSFVSSLLLFSSGVVVALGFIQFFFYPDLRNLFYLGWDEHLYRLFSSFLDPNFAGAFFVGVAVLLSSYSIERKKAKQKVYGWYLGGSILTVVALLLTYSRSAFLMAFVGGGVLLWSYGYKKLVALFCVILVIGIGILSFSNRSEGTNLFRMTSTKAHLVSQTQAFTIFLDHPLFGVGLNGYRRELLQRGFLTQEQQDINHAGNGTDNSFLFVFATTGVVGGICFVLFLGSLLRVLVQQTARKKTETSVFLHTGFSFLVSLCIGSLFIHFLFYPLLLLYLFVILGMALGKEGK